MVNTSLTPSPRHLRSGNVPWVRLLSYDLVHAFSDSWADDHILHRGLGVSKTFSSSDHLTRTSDEAGRLCSRLTAAPAPSEASLRSGSVSWTTHGDTAAGASSTSSKAWYRSSWPLLHTSGSKRPQSSREAG